MSETLGWVDFDPVITKRLDFSGHDQRQQGPSPILCPGTPVTFLTAHNQAKNRLEVDAKGLLLENFATHIPERVRTSGPQELSPTPMPEQQ